MDVRFTQEESRTFVGAYHWAEGLGAGSYGDVRKVTNTFRGAPLSVAIKRQSTTTPWKAKCFVTEQIVLSMAADKLCPNIIKVLGSYQSLGAFGSGHSSYLIFELAECDGHSYFISNRPPLTAELWEYTRSAVREMALGLHQLHGLGFVHNDVKLANYMRVHGVWKLGDLGMARMSSSLGRSFVNYTAGYSPPEPIDELDKTSDWFAFGKAVSYIVSGKEGMIPILSNISTDLAKFITELVRERKEDRLCGLHGDGTIVLKHAYLTPPSIPQPQKGKLGLQEMVDSTNNSPIINKHAAKYQRPRCNCPNCGLELFDRSTMRRHLLKNRCNLRKPVDKEYECTTCSRQFVSKQNLNRHMRMFSHNN